MSIPAYNDHAPNFTAIAYVISRARELASADAEGQASLQRNQWSPTTSATEQQSLLASNRSTPGFLRRFLEHAGW